MTIECDCGYLCRGATEAEAVAAARRHALEAHGVEVTAEQVLAAAKARGDAG